MNIDICVCTFQRPQVAATLRSLAQLNLRPDWKIHVIVADNDDTPSAENLVISTADQHSLPLTYIHAPARNISVARNACLNAATAPLTAFIDDDEIATPDWLQALMTIVESTQADVVLGPVNAVYAADCPGWIRSGNFHSTKPVWVHGEIVTGYTCNVLLQRTAAALANRHFRPELGRTGGEDTVFFRGVHRAGGKIAYAPDALVTEVVPPQRTNLQWLLSRYFRSGQTHGLLLLEGPGASLLSRAVNILIAAVKSLFCLTMVIPHFFSSLRAHYWLLRGVMHAGVVARLLGKAELEQYG